MNKPLLLLAVATLLLGTSGCGCCRGLFGKSSSTVATPVYSHYAPSCGTTCCPSCGSSSSCGCESGTAVTYGYNGEVSLAPTEGIESTPLTVTSGNTTFGN